jgi:hypothetical protein
MANCANMYNWINQSQEHQRYAMTNYPVAFKLARIASSYEEFITLAQDIRRGEGGSYLLEYNAWLNKWGNTWDQLGCPHEYALGEHTNSFKFQARPTPSRNMRLQDYGQFDQAEGPRFSLAGLSGLGQMFTVGGLAGYPQQTTMSCFSGRCGLGAVDDENGQSTWEDFEDDSDDWDGGTPSSMPTLKSGYYWCNSAPSEIRMTQAARASEAPGWTVTTYAGVDNQLYYRYDHAGTNVRKWACPMSNRPAAQQKADVKLIQNALLKAGYPVGSTGADGIIGKNTCAAAYKFAAERLNEYGGNLSANFYKALGLAGKDFEVKYARLCTSYYKDVGLHAPTTPVEPPKPPKAQPPKVEPPKPDVPVVVPEPAKAGFPLWLGIGLGAAAVGGVLYSKFGRKKGRR